MEQRLKQRLVGAIVLVSLAVVFVPILFDVSHEADEEVSTTPVTGIPDRPRDRIGPTVSITLEVPQTPRLDAAVERERTRNAFAPATSEGSVPGSASTASGATASTPVASVSEPSASRPDPAPARSNPAPEAVRPDGGSGKERAVQAPVAGGWTVQLGSFRKSENALALRERLQARGYPAFVESGSSAQGAVSRVFVGPMPDRGQAQDSAAKLRREMALEGIVVPYPGG